METLSIIEGKQLTQPPASTRIKPQWTKVQSQPHKNNTTHKSANNDILPGGASSRMPNNYTKKAPYKSGDSKYNKNKSFRVVQEQKTKPKMYQKIATRENKLLNNEVEEATGAKTLTAGEVPAETQAAVQDAPWYNEYKNIRQTMFKLGIKVSHEPYGPNWPLAIERPKRIILTSLSRNQLSQVNTECNGLILELDTKKPLIISPPQFITSVDTTQVNAELEKNTYDIYAIEDGTTINMYYWPAEKACPTDVTAYIPWRIATSNGIDVSDVRWAQKTYREVLHEVFLNKDIVPETFYSSLDKNKCYTLGFRHPEFHPFGAGDDSKTCKLWAIQSVELESEELSLTEKNMKYKRSYEAFGGLQVQEPLEEYVGITNIRILYRTLASALNDFIDSSSSKSTPKVCFGYILRPHDPNSQIRPVLLESSLLRMVKRLHYAREISREAHEFGYDRIKYLILRAYVSQSTHDFIQLFPQYKTQYAQLDEVVNNLAAKLLAEENKDDSAEIVKLRTDLSKHINVTKIVDKKDTLVKTFIKAYKYLDIIYHSWCSSSEK